MKTHIDAVQPGDRMIVTDNELPGLSWGEQPYVKLGRTETIARYGKYVECSEGRFYLAETMDDSGYLNSIRKA